jgi:hypothetical protein
MIYDDIDIILVNIFNDLKKTFVNILDIYLEENEEKMLNIERSLEKVIVDYKK